MVHKRRRIKKEVKREKQNKQTLVFFLRNPKLGHVIMFLMSFNETDNYKEFEQLLTQAAGTDDDFCTLYEKIRQYDVYDFLKRLAALTCLPANQNKEVVICGLIEELLSHQKSDYPNSSIMSYNRFQQIIIETGRLEVTNQIDPPEGPVIQKIKWNGSIFSCFPGMDKNSVFRLQLLIDVISQERVNNNDFLNSAYSILQLTLIAQDRVANKMGLAEGFCEETSNRAIQLKTNKELLEIVDIMTLKLSSTLEEKYKRLLESITCKFGQKKTHDNDNYSFYDSPFLFDEQNNSIIPLDIGILTDFSFKAIISLATTYNLVDQIIDSYNQISIRRCHHYLNRLGHVAIFPKLLTEDNLSAEIVFSAYESEILIIEFIKENVNNVSLDNLIQIEEGKRCIELSNKLIDHGFGSASFSYLIILNTSSLSYSIHSFNTEKLYGSVTLLRPLELECLAINEIDSEDFIPRFSNSYGVIKCPTRSFTNTLDVMCFYKNNNYSFYRDEMDIRKTPIYFSIGFSRDYVAKAVKESSPVIIPYYQIGTYVNVIGKDRLRNIFGYVRKDKIEECVIINNFFIWILSQTILDEVSEHVSRTVIDVLTFWIGENSSQLRQTFNFDGMAIIKVKLIDNPQEYLYATNEITDYNYDISITQNIIELNVAAAHFRQLNCIDNRQEKKLFLQIIQAISSICNCPLSITFDAFSNPHKKLVVSSNLTDYLYLKPVITDTISRRIHEDDISTILDEIGDSISTLYRDKRFLGKECCLKVLESIIQFLQKKAISIIKKYKILSVLLLAYEDMERAIYETRNSEQRLINDLACYPERREYYLSKASDHNRFSLTIKCLIEVLTTVNNPDNNCLPEINRRNYELLLAICNLIISWGRTRDALYHGIIKDEIVILPSGRVGIDYLEIDLFSKEANEFKSSDSISSNTEPNYLANHIAELDSAYKKDFGYSLSEKLSVIEAISRIKFDKELVHSCKKSELVSLVQKTNRTTIEPPIIQQIIDVVTLKERKELFISPNGFEKRDAYPWKFSRQYCFIRRPIIQFSDSLYWGSRNISFMLHEELGLIYTRKLRTNKSPNVDSVLEKIAKERSDYFNDLIFQRLSTFNSFQVKKNVKKDSNGRRIANENGNDLGDIDVLALDMRNRNLYVIEVKNYQFSRNNPDEIANELKKMEEHHEKHLKRVQWVCKNINEVCKLFKIDNHSKYKVKEVIITKAPVLGKIKLDKTFNVICEHELTEKKILSLPIFS